MAISAPSNEVDICNLALTQLKQAHIVQVDPATTTVEQMCATHYHQVRRALLRAHPWNFAVKRASLTPEVGATPLYGYSHAYRKPSDFIRYLSRHDSQGIRINPDDYELEGNHILANGEDGSAIYVRYVYNHNVVTEWDPLFIQLFAIDLAIALAPQFQGSERRVVMLTEQRDQINTESRAIDAQERPPTRKQRSNWLYKRQYRPRVADKYTRFYG